MPIYIYLEWRRKIMTWIGLKKKKKFVLLNIFPKSCIQVRIFYSKDMCLCIFTQHAHRYTYVYWYVHGNLFQYSCLANCMDRGAWWAIVHGIRKSCAWLSNWALTHTYLYVRTRVFYGMETVWLWHPNFMMCLLPPCDCKLLNISASQFSCLYNGNNNSYHVTEQADD